MALLMRRDEMNLLWLLAVPPATFLAACVIAPLGKVISFTVQKDLDDGSWWAFPLYMALALPAVLVAIALVMASLLLAFGAVAISVSQ